MHGAKTIYYCSSSNSNAKSQQQPQSTNEGSTLASGVRPKAKAGDGDAVSLVKEKNLAGDGRGDQMKRGSGGCSVIYYNTNGPTAKSVQQPQLKLSEVNNNTATSDTSYCNNDHGPESSHRDTDDHDGDTVTCTFKRASSAAISCTNIQMETEVAALEIGNVQDHGRNNNTIANAKNTAQSNGNSKGDNDKDTSASIEGPQPLPLLQQPKLEFAHPIHDAPAKCNLVESIRTLFMDVIVTNAVSPLNFSIQSYKDYGKLKLLEAHMTNWYTSTSGSVEPLQFQNLTLNGFYAVKYTPPPSPAGNVGGVNSKAQFNGKSMSTSANYIDANVQWRRCQIIKPFSQSLPILTNLVDHGCYFMTEPKNVQPLRKIYTELPCQSLEAKLHFVDTKKIQFTPEDCHRFHKQVESKPFSSIIMKPLQPSTQQQQQSESSKDAKVSVVLIDTSGEKDHYIHHDYIVPKKKS